jgi:hypothetical protein
MKIKMHEPESNAFIFAVDRVRKQIDKHFRIRTTHSDKTRKEILDHIERGYRDALEGRTQPKSAWDAMKDE